MDRSEEIAAFLEETAPGQGLYHLPQRSGRPPGFQVSGRERDRGRGGVAARQHEHRDRRSLLPRQPRETLTKQRDRRRWYRRRGGAGREQLGDLHGGQGIATGSGDGETQVFVCPTSAPGADDPLDDRVRERVQRETG